MRRNRAGSLWAAAALSLALPGLVACEGASANPTEPEASRPTAEAAGAEASAPDLSGVWVLNREESDPPPRHRGARAPRRGERPPPGGEDGPPPGLEPPIGESGAGPRHGPPTGAGAGGPAELHIEQTASTVTFSRGGDRAHTLPTDGTATSRETPRGSVEIRASWEGESLVVVRAGPAGGRLTRSYSLEGGDRLVVVVRMERAEKEAREHRLVFDRAES